MCYASVTHSQFNIFMISCKNRSAAQRTFRTKNLLSIQRIFL